MNELEKIIKKGRGWILTHIIKQTSINYLRGLKDGVMIGRNFDYKEKGVYLYYINEKITDLSIDALNQVVNDDCLNQVVNDDCLNQVVNDD